MLGVKISVRPDFRGNVFLLLQNLTSQIDASFKENKARTKSANIQPLVDMYDSPYSQVFCVQLLIGHKDWAHCCSSLQTIKQTGRKASDNSLHYVTHNAQMSTHSNYTQTWIISNLRLCIQHTMVRTFVVRKERYVLTSRAAGREATKETAKLCLLCTLILACWIVTASIIRYSLQNNNTLHSVSQAEGLIISPSFLSRVLKFNIYCFSTALNSTLWMQAD